jgi:hypothetical protein
VAAVHFPITLAFMSFPAHIVAVFLFWGWK